MVEGLDPNKKRDSMLIRSLRNHYQSGRDNYQDGKCRAPWSCRFLGPDEDFVDSLRSIRKTYFHYYLGADYWYYILILHSLLSVYFANRHTWVCVPLVRFRFDATLQLYTPLCIQTASRLNLPSGVQLANRHRRRCHNGAALVKIHLTA